MEYFVHNGYVGMSYGTPGNPQLINIGDAQKLMELADLSIEQISKDFPPAQFAETGESLYLLFGNNRFIQYGDITKCGDVKKRNVSQPLTINWNKT
jgi:hypothetical protein|tara:strand:- start:60 stop:347 length:288 start_codon:yes stop_codon:yes gene_type:complete